MEKSPVPQLPEVLQQLAKAFSLPTRMIAPAALFSTGQDNVHVPQSSFHETPVSGPQLVSHHVPSALMGSGKEEVL